MITRTTLVVGPRAAVREAAIAARVASGIPTALILEGLPDGTDKINQPASLAQLHIVRIAPGCLCCTGNLTMRVTLNRILRHPPQQLFISLATSAHLARLQEFLSQAPYDALLALTEVLQCDAEA